jgi:hypothetical protein
MSLALVGLALSLSAHAQEPQVSVLADKETVRATVEIEVDAATTAALIRDHRNKAIASGQTDMTIEDVRQDGACEVKKWTVPHPVKTVSYTARSCQTDAGTIVKLVESDDFDAFTSDWRVEPAGEGRSRLVVLLRSIPSFPIPGAIARAQTKAALARSLTNIKANLEALPGR